ncbi:MAG: TPR end-of-group domain-containing protein [Chthoniobacterales bacterium]
MAPIAKDPIDGPSFALSLATAYAWTGERDLALDQLEMLARIPSLLSYGELHYSPDWDSLRGDPRFEKIVASFKPADVR